MSRIVLSLLVFLLRGANAANKLFNLTDLLNGVYDYDSKLQSGELSYNKVGVPVFRDFSYLPEENYRDAITISDEMNEDQSELSLERNGRNITPEYRSLCEVVTRRTQLTDSEYEYQPPFYHDIFCKSQSVLEPVTKPLLQKCVYPVFHCVQRSRTLFLVRRKWESDCWEPFTREIASGCDCMWPVSVLGDISIHY